MRSSLWFSNASMMVCSQCEQARFSYVFGWFLHSGFHVADKYVQFSCHNSNYNYKTQKQQPLCVVFCILGSLCTNTLPPVCYYFRRSLTSLLFCTVKISCTNNSKQSRTLRSWYADVSMKRSWFFSANPCAYSRDTLRSAGLLSHKSNLFPTSIITISGSACSFTSLIHF